MSVQQEYFQINLRHNFIINFLIFVFIVLSVSFAPLCSLGFGDSEIIISLIAFFILFSYLFEYLEFFGGVGHVIYYQLKSFHIGLSLLSFVTHNSLCNIYKNSFYYHSSSWVILFSSSLRVFSNKIYKALLIKGHKWA